MNEELRKEIERMDQFTKYMKILDDHHFFDPDDNSVMENLVHILETMRVIVGAFNPEDKTDRVFDIMKVLANLCMFEDVVMPICRRYNPTEEDKAKFLEWLKDHPVDSQ